MQLIISVLILFILINCVLKLSFWRIWQAALFGAVCGAFVIATYPYAILQSKTQLADYLQNTTALQNMAVIITLESVVCFAYCIAVLRRVLALEKAEDVLERDISVLDLRDPQRPMLRLTEEALAEIARVKAKLEHQRDRGHALRHQAAPSSSAASHRSR